MNKSRILCFAVLLNLLIGLGFIFIGPQCVDTVNTPIAAVGFPFILLSGALFLIWIRKRRKGKS